MNLRDVTAFRLRLLELGFVPLPLFGKEPPIYGKNNSRKGLAGWQELYAKVTPTEVNLWEKIWPDAGNTGILTRRTPAADIDITDPEAAEAVEALAREHFEERGLVPVRIGKPPKRAILLRTDEPFPKMTARFTAPDGSKHKIEVLGDGQQVVVAGIHPETKQPYRWFGGVPWEVPRAELPYVRADDMRAFLTAATELLIAEHGFELAEGDAKAGAETTNNTADETTTGDHDPDSLHHTLNQEALAKLDLWVPALGLARCRRHGLGYEAVADWRPSSTGRPLAQRAYNLKISPKAIKDFGADKGYSAINLVMAARGCNLDQAFGWLSDRLGHTRNHIHIDPPEQHTSEPPKAADGTGASSGAEAKPQSASKPRFLLIPFNDIKLGTAVTDLIKGVIPRTGIAVIWGPPKSGKSFWTFDLVMHVARGLEYRGHRVKQGPVVYCAFEGQKGFEKRVEAYRREHKLEPDTVVPLFFSMHPVQLVRDHKALIASVRGQIGTTAPVALVLDTLNRSIDGSESKDEDMKAYLDAADAIHYAFECVVIVVHHCGVNETRPRGHTSLTGTTVAQLAVKRGDTDDTLLTEIEYMKDGPAGTRFASLRRVVDLGVDDDGDPMTSCVIEPIEAGGTSKPKTKKDVVWESSLLRRCLMTMLAETGMDLKPYPDGPTVRAVDQELVRSEFYKSYPAEGDAKAKLATRQKAFKRAVNQAQADKHIGVREVGEVIWLWLAQLPPGFLLRPTPRVQP